MNSPEALSVAGCTRSRPTRTRGRTQTSRGAMASITCSCITRTTPHGPSDDRGAQVLSIARKGSDPRDLEVLAKKALNSLNQGMDIEEAKLLVKFKLQNLSKSD